VELENKATFHVFF